MKEINLEKSVYELTEAYPELIDILKELGFFWRHQCYSQKHPG